MSKVVDGRGTQGEFSGRRRKGGTVSLAAKNLNTLPVLHALLVESSVVGAAERVGLSQPTVSGVLARLRTEFGDPLLVRQGRGMRLTPRAQQLLPEVVELCHGLERLFDPPEVDPSTLDRRYVIAAPDHLSFQLAPPLLARLSAEAPGVRIRFVNVPSDLTAPIRDDEIDLAVCGNFGLWENLRFLELFEQRIVLAVACDHPLAGRDSVTSDDVLAYPVVGTNPGVFRRRRAGAVTGVPVFDIEQRFTFSQFTDAVMLAVAGEVVAPAPEGLVRFLAQRLPIVGVRLSEADVVSEGIFWSPLREHDAEHTWLRSVVVQALTESI